MVILSVRPSIFAQASMNLEGPDLDERTELRT